MYHRKEMIKRQIKDLIEDLHGIHNAMDAQMIEEVTRDEEIAAVDPDGPPMSRMVSTTFTEDMEFLHERFSHTLDFMRNRMSW